MEGFFEGFREDQPVSVTYISIVLGIQIELRALVHL